uniref:Putative capsid protein n=1 Tax=Rodent picobirnavirus TaxID=2863997 RepID=A0A8K1HGR6_9VIRU|nr:putative capsid protein [Rodent picobirnavirus]
MKGQKNSKKSSKKFHPRKSNKKDFKGQYDAREKRDIVEDTKELQSKCNDWRWYAQNPQLVKDYASFPFGVPVGNNLPKGIPGYSSNNIPGICSIYFAPTIGNSTDANAPVNVAARNIYSFVRHVNSGHANYDAPDLMLYLLAMDSAYMYHEYLKRIARIVLDYSVFSRYYPDGLMAAMGVDYTDVQENIASLRGFINIMAVKLGSMCVPNSMSYTARHMWMAGSLFLDSNTTKAQTYIYVPSYYMQFALGGESGTVGMLKTMQAPGLISTASTPAKVSDLINFANELMDPILSNEDMNIMSGDILKAFGNEGVVKLSGITEGEALLPNKVEEVLSQIENATVMPFNMAVYTIDQKVGVGEGYLVPSYQFQTTVQLPTGVTTDAFESNLRALLGTTNNNRAIMNFHWDGVTPEDVIVATRLTTVPQVTQVSELTGAATITWNVAGLSSEVITDARLFQVSTVPGEKYFSRSFAKFSFFDQTDAVNAYPISMCNILSNFDWSPDFQAYIIHTPTGSNQQVISSPMLSLRDTDNYTIISDVELENLATVCLLSQFSVPQMGTFSKKM